MERMEPGFVAQELIAQDRFRGSTLGLCQACDVFKQPVYLELGTVTKLRVDHAATGTNVGAKKAREMRMSYE